MIAPRVGKDRADQRHDESIVYAAIASYSYVPDVKLLQGFPRGARIAPTLLNLNPSSIPGLNERKADSVRQIRCIPCNLRS
ncbi:hypothetical protein Y032_0191g1331 [Ancylostoma ceylanicum]|uniref:Uncharacterized protein n=1 Tax=Ancylostoma ceylanicum TaxID=53326 RepID=A0A016SQ36_9BILA|nr:hypothetical protein Y032_0191g1331 [Ancylostoma ceylanicum]